MNNSILNNLLLVSVFIGWFAAQIIKTALDCIANKSFNKERLLGSGGMPSSHSAAVSAFATTAGLTYGVESFEFAFAVILACIVMYDACGIRRAVGEHARLLNDLSGALNNVLSGDIPFDDKLKVLIGHTPLQVFAGLILGLLTGFALYFKF